MNIHNVNFVSQNHNFVNNQKEANPFFAGNRFSARVASENQGSFLMEIVGGGSFNTKFENLNPSIGDMLDFEVVSTGENVALKLMTVQEESKISEMKSEDIIELFKQSGFVKEIEETDVNTGDTQDLELDRLLKNIKNSLANAGDNISLAAVNKLLAQGIPIGELDISAVQTQVAQLEPQLQENANFVGESSNKFEDILNKYDLPYTNNNVSNLQKALDVFNESSQLEDKNLALAVDKEELTLGDLYKTKYSANSYFSVKEPIEGFDEKLTALFDSQEIETSEENIALGNLLFEQDLEITKENIDKINYLKNLSTNESYVLDQAAVNIKEGNPLLDIDLLNIPSKELEQNYLTLLSNLGNLTPQHVDMAVSQGVEVTLENLNNIVLPEINIGYTPDNITFKRQLAEIQAKLTHEAAYKLADKNIDINTMPIDKALSELKAIENEKYNKLLASNGVEQSQIEAATETMVNLYDSLDSAKRAKHLYQPNLLTKEVEFNLSEIDKKVLAEKKLQGYDAFMTMPNAKYGDSFNKVKDQLAGVLEGIGLEPTEENIRSASILSRSQMDVSYENMMAIKVMDKKIETIADTLHPIIAVEMLKDGINPLEKHVDELIEYIEGYNDKYGNGIKDKLASHIVSIQDDITSEERSKMMAVYKTLNEINKYDGAALGINLQSGTAMTLGHLLDSSNYYTKTKGRHNAINLDSDMGYDDVTKKETIRNLLNEVGQAETKENIARIENMLAQNKMRTNSEINEQTYNDMLLKEAAAKLNPEELLNLSDNEPLEDKLGTLKEKTINKANKIVDDILEHVKDNEKAIHFLRTSDMPATVLNVETLSKMMGKPQTLKEKLNEVTEKFTQSDIDKVPEELTQYLEGASEEVEQVIEELVFTDVNVKEINYLKNAIKLQSRLNVGTYTLPVRIDGKVSTLQMFVNGKTGDQMSLAISLNLEKFGEVGALLKLNGPQIEMFLNNEDEQNINLFRENHDRLTELLGNEGFTLLSVMYGEEVVDNFNESYDKITQTTKNDLFKMATAFTKFLDAL